MRLDYDELRRIYRAEKNSTKLVDVEQDFFESLAGFFAKEKADYLRSLRDPGSGKAKSFSNLRKIVAEIFSIREKKLLNKALIASRTGELLDASIAGKERETLKQLLNVLNKHQKILDEILSMPEQAKKKEQPGKFSVRILQNVPAFVGSDMREYGPFEKEKVVSLPEKIASLLVSRKLAEKARG